jgi:hypothetical protein
MGRVISQLKIHFQHPLPLSPTMHHVMSVTLPLALAMFLRTVPLGKLNSYIKAQKGALKYTACTCGSLVKSRGQLILSEALPSEEQSGDDFPKR